MNDKVAEDEAVEDDAETPEGEGGGEGEAQEECAKGGFKLWPMDRKTMMIAAVPAVLLLLGGGYFLGGNARPVRWRLWAGGAKKPGLLRLARDGGESEFV